VTTVAFLLRAAAVVVAGFGVQRTVLRRAASPEHALLATVVAGLTLVAAASFVGAWTGAFEAAATRGRRCAGFPALGVIAAASVGQVRAALLDATWEGRLAPAELAALEASSPSPVPRLTAVR
jgi:hypothetical protein